MVRAVFCDESGFTGPNLFLDPQRYYVYASVAMPPDLAIEGVEKMRADYRIVTDELKYEKLSKNARGQNAIEWFLKNYGEYVAFYADKRFAAAGKFVEYTFEPVLRAMKKLFYATLPTRRDQDIDVSDGICK